MVQGRKTRDKRRSCPIDDLRCFFIIANLLKVFTFSNWHRHGDSVVNTLVVGTGKEFGKFQNFQIPKIYFQNLVFPKNFFPKISSYTVV